MLKTRKQHIKNLKNTIRAYAMSADGRPGEYPSQFVQKALQRRYMTHSDGSFAGAILELVRSDHMRVWVDTSRSVVCGFWKDVYEEQPYDNNGVRLNCQKRWENMIETLTRRNQK